MMLPPKPELVVRQSAIDRLKQLCQDMTVSKKEYNKSLKLAHDKLLAFSIALSYANMTPKQINRDKIMRIVHKY